LFKLRWDGNQTDLKVPNYGLPKINEINSKVGSLENIKHKPGEHNIIWK
jgi:hypothetical protein